VFIALIEVPLHIFSFRSFALISAPASTEKHPTHFVTFRKGFRLNYPNTRNLTAVVNRKHVSSRSLSQGSHSIDPTTVLPREDNPYLQLKRMEPMSGVDRRPTDYEFASRGVSY
jgi:hypothetical protein